MAAEESAASGLSHRHPEDPSAALLGHRYLPKPTGSAPYPAGLYWMHAHLHGVARPQVTTGMSALISVGDEKDSIAQAPQKVGI